MTYTNTQIHDAINAWAETQVDEDIADSIESGKKLNEQYGGRTTWRSSNKIPWPTKVEEFNREDVRDRIAESFYEPTNRVVELPGLGEAVHVDNYGGEGLGEEYWRIIKIGDEYYKADHYYSSYDGGDNWHGVCTIFPVESREVTKIEWFAK